MLGAQMLAGKALLPPHGATASFPKACNNAKEFPPASKIFVRNLPSSTSEARLRRAFSSFGHIAEDQSKMLCSMTMAAERVFDITFFRTVFSISDSCDVKIPTENGTKKPKGYAFIQYSTQDEAVMALENMDGMLIDGRAVMVEIAKPIRNRTSSYPITSGPPK